MESRKSIDSTKFRPVAASRWVGELLSFRHDVSHESHDRDYRSLCIFFVADCASKNIRVLVFDINHVVGSGPRFRLNIFNTEGPPLITLGKLLICCLRKAICVGPNVHMMRIIGFATNGETVPGSRAFLRGFMLVGENGAWGE